MVTSSLPDQAQARPDIEELLCDLSAEQFRRWYRERQYRQNIQNGQPYFNGSGSVPDPDKHSPSQLLQCHRKLVYRQENAPQEREDPKGIFWFGTKFEEDLLFPFLERTVTGSDTYVQNSIWIDFTVQTETRELRIKGSTDPVIVDSDATPILPTEIKTKSAAGDISEPNTHHRAQLHAYLVGLSERFDREFSEGVIIYGGREALDLAAFHVEFDEEFWHEKVLEWATDHTQYRVNDRLPPADPEYDWECRFCSFRTRCGKGDSPHEDCGPKGLLPGVKDYPREKVIEYLEGHPDETLTPTLARQYPDLVEVYGVAQWFCDSCDSEIDWQTVETVDSPVCPQCADEGRLSVLSLVEPEQQQQSSEKIETRGPDQTQ